MFRSCLLLLATFFVSLLSAQMEEQTAFALRYGPARVTSRLALTTIEVDPGAENAFAIQDRAMRWMRGTSAGLSIRSNVTGRAVLSASADYLSFNDPIFSYASIPGSDLRLPTRLEPRNRFWSVTGSLGAHYRVTPEESKLDIQFGVVYQYTLYRHQYASYLRFISFPDGSIGLAEEDREEVGSNRDGGAVAARVALPIIGSFGLSLDAKYGWEQEEGVFDQTLFTQVGLVFYFK